MTLIKEIDDTLIMTLIKEQINKVDSDAEVILYGSRARKSHRPDSDWDLLILTDEELNYEEEKAYRYPLYELEVELGQVFSVMVFSKQNWNTQQRMSPLYGSVVSEGVKL